nr:hypothetical protein [Tanacetum cinerariifolium]
TVKRLTKLLDKPKREFQTLKRAVFRLHQNESLPIARRSLFNDEVSISNNTGTKPPTPLRTLHEHSHPNSSGFQNPIILSARQTGRIIDARDILLIQRTCTFQGLRSEDLLHHVKHYLSIFDNIQADGTTRDTSGIRFFHLSLKGKATKWFDRIPPTQITTWDQLVSQFLEYFFLMTNPAEQVCLSRGDMYDDPSHLRVGSDVHEGAVIDVHEGKLSLRVGSVTIAFNIRKSMKSKHSCNDYLYCADHTTKLVQEQWADTVNHDRKWTEEEEEENSNEELPKQLEYVFLQENNQLPGVISSALSIVEKSRILEVLRNHKGAIAWSITNIKGIESSFYTQKILMEYEFKPSVKPQ